MAESRKALQKVEGQMVGMVERGNGNIRGRTADRTAEWQNGRMAERGRTAERHNGYILNLPNIFTVHTDTDTNTDTF